MVEETRELNPDDRPDPYVNGAHRNSSQGDFLLERNRQGDAWNALKNFVFGSEEPTRYLPMTEISEKEISRLTRIKAQKSRHTRGFTDIEGAMTLKYNARMGLNRQRTKEFVKAFTGTPVREDYRQGNQLRAKSIDKGEVPVNSRP
jgi:hypothetical protein